MDFLEAKGEKGKGFSLFLQARMELLEVTILLKNKLIYFVTLHIYTLTSPNE